MGIAFLVFSSVMHKIGLFAPKIEAIPTPCWRTTPHPKFRQPTHCARKSRIRQTRKGALLLTSQIEGVVQPEAQPHLAHFLTKN
jgi:hypothetical protein